MGGCSWGIASSTGISWPRSVRLRSPCSSIRKRQGDQTFSKVFQANLSNLESQSSPNPLFSKQTTGLYLNWNRHSQSSYSCRGSRRHSDRPRLLFRFSKATTQHSSTPGPPRPLPCTSSRSRATQHRKSGGAILRRWCSLAGWRIRKYLPAS